MRRIIVTLAAATLFSAPASSIEAHTSEVRAMLIRPIERLKTADYRASGHLVRVDPAGKRTSLPITLKAHWFPDVLRVLCAINKSGPAAGQSNVHILLEMRLNGQNSIQIAHPGDKAPVVLPFEKWSGGPMDSSNSAVSAFSYEDFLESQYFWPIQTSLGNARFGARDCDLLKSAPGASDRTHYAEIRTWLDHTVGYPVYVEKTLKAKGTVKEFTYFGLRQVGGVWSASQVEGKIRGQSGSTLLMIDRGTTKANLDLRDFSAEELTRF